ncbi:dockerin type I domain-containing protein [Paenibacillus sp. FSL W7-1088]|uniref:dockerin type I repeat-containing protein n=1 Tax=Paenibacillus sp. FSL W7-1088 TaxID=2921695 RepID=UPI0030EEBDC5
MNLYTGKDVRVNFTQWSVLALVITLLTSVSFPSSSALAAAVPISLSQPKDIEFYKTADGKTEMLIADSGNDRVIRATAGGVVLSTMVVNHLTAATVEPNGLIYAAESGAAAKVHIFNPDGTVHSPYIDVMSKFSLQPAADDAKQPYIKSMAMIEQNNKNNLIMAYSSYGKNGNDPQSSVWLSTIYLDGSGTSGGSGGYTENSSVIRGDNKSRWYTQSGGVILQDITNIFNNSINYGDLAADSANKLLYVVTDDQIMRTSYEGATYTNRPVLSPWLSSSPEHPIRAGNPIAVGPGGEVYMADTADDRIVVFNPNGTFNRILELAWDINQIPTVSSFSKTIKVGQPVIFSKQDFEYNFADADGEPLSDIRITSLPLSGKLQLNDTDVTQNQVIPVTELAHLKFIAPTVGEKVTFNWQAKDGRDFSEEATVTIMLRIKGDANGDGVITPADALLVNKYIKGLITLTPGQIEALDMNDDGVLDAKDSALIMGVYLGINS